MDAIGAYAKSRADWSGGSMLGREIEVWHLAVADSLDTRGIHLLPFGFEERAAEVSKFWNF